MINKWNYDPAGEVCYGEEIVYQKARDFLGDSVEDWGCGTCWAKRYFKDYKGIDGSPSICVSKPIDLVNYTSHTDNILIRQVLEHNYEWKKIIENAKKSFNKKLCITIHTPLSDTTHAISLLRRLMTTLPGVPAPQEQRCACSTTFSVQNQQLSSRMKRTYELAPWGRFEMVMNG